jgi:hypothetical protein
MEEAAAAQSPPLRFAGAVFVEALSDGPAKEAEWIQSLADRQAQQRAHSHQWLKGMVAYAYLPDDDIDAQLAAVARFPIVHTYQTPFHHHQRVLLSLTRTLAWCVRVRVRVRVCVRVRVRVRVKQVKGIRQIINHHPDDPSLTWPKVLFTPCSSGLNCADDTVMLMRREGV